MDTPADPATPFAAVYPSFLADLASEGLKSTPSPATGTTSNDLRSGSPRTGTR